LTTALVRNMGTCRPDVVINLRDGQSKRGIEYAGSELRAGEVQAADL
jgi:hypothetical protein